MLPITLLWTAALAWAEDPAPPPVNATETPAPAVPAAPPAAPPPPADAAPAPVAPVAVSPPAAPPAPPQEAAPVATADVPPHGAAAPLDDRLFVSVVVGAQQVPGPAFDLFAEGDLLASAGVRVGGFVTPKLALFADWQRGRQGADLGYGTGDAYNYDYEYTYADDSYSGFDYDSGSVETQVGTHTVTLGARLHTDAFAGWLRPYVAGGLGAMVATGRFDDDAGDPESPGQVQGTGAGVGLVGLGGVEGRFRPSTHAAFVLTAHVEVGAAAYSRVSLGDLGGLTPRGGVVRGGLGIAF